MIGFFGKLPGSADFIAHHAGHKDIRELDGWWQRALNRMAERDEGWQARFDALPLCFFHYRASGGAWLMGAMTPSQDASGRRYPLLVFQRLAVSPVVEGSLGVHTLSETFAGQLRELLRDVMHCADPQQAQCRLLKGVEALRELNDSDLKLHRRLFAQFLDDVRYVDLTRALTGGFPEVVPQGFARRMQALRRQLAEGVSECIALPLPPERALKRPAADLWLYWLEHDNGPMARISVIMDDFMRPTLLRFSRDDHDALRILAGTVPESLGVGTQETMIDKHCVPDTLGIGAYIAAVGEQEMAGEMTVSEMAASGVGEHAVAEYEAVEREAAARGEDRDLGDTFKDDSAPT